MASSGLRGWFERHPRVAAVVIAVMVVGVGLVDAGRLADSGLEESARSTAMVVGGVLGLAVLASFVVAGRSLGRGGIVLLSIPVTLVWLVLFFITHRRRGEDPPLDSSFLVAAATFTDVVLVLGGLAVAGAVMVRGRPLGQD